MSSLTAQLAILVAGMLGLALIVQRVMVSAAKSAAAQAEAMTTGVGDAMIRAIESTIIAIAPTDVVEQQDTADLVTFEGLRSWVEDLADPDSADDWTDEPMVERVFRGMPDEIDPIDPQIGRPDMIGEL